MNTKSSPAKNNYVPGASRQPRSAATLRAQMEDLARGERIKTLREERHLTQPAVIDLLEKRAGAKVVTLRGYQAWEAGGGIRWENVKVLAEIFAEEPEFIMSGRRASEVPDLSLIQGAARQDQVDGGFDEFREHVASLHERIGGLEQALREASAERVGLVDQILDLLKKQSELLARQTELIESLQSAADRLPDGPTIQDHLVQELHDALARTAPPPEPQARP